MAERNVWRGLRRLYSVFCALWIVLVIVLAAVNYRPSPGREGRYTSSDIAEGSTPKPGPWTDYARPATAALPPGFDPIGIADAYHLGATESAARYYMDAAAIATLPPLAGYLLFFVAGGWVIRGFARGVIARGKVSDFSGNDDGRVQMHKEIVIAIADLRYVSIACPHCRARVVLDLREKTEFAARHDLFAPKKCPSCDTAYDSAIQPAVDELQRCWQSLMKIAGQISFRGESEPLE